jgi:hypothetical protein
MKYNHKKIAQNLTYDHQDKALSDARESRGHVETEKLHYDRLLDEGRKNSEPTDIHEKQLSELHNDDGKKLVETMLNDEGKRDDSTWDTNTLPINELAEEAQRARIKERGDGSGFNKSHYQKHKQESKDLSGKNYANLSDVVKQIDKMWMAASWNRMTTSEKKEIETLIAKRDNIITKVGK